MARRLKPLHGDWNPNGVILDRTEVNGISLVLLATGIKVNGNGKIGKKGSNGPVQLWVLPEGISPTEARRDPMVAAILCGNCSQKRDPETDGGCYVQDRHLASMGRCLARGGYRDYTGCSDRQLLALLWDRVLRWTGFGAGALRFGEFLRRCDRLGIDGWGYSHEWRDLDPFFNSLLMASTEDPASTRLAWSKGWRTFRVRAPGSPLLDGEVQCPADESKGITCERCRLCDGTRKGAKSISIEAHGALKRKATKLVQIEG